MNDCMNVEIQEMLPDLLHESLAASERTRIETHLASCAACVDELRVLQLVKSAAVFEPTIDAGSIVRQIPPYRTILPASQKPARSRMVTWLTAASVAVVVALVGGVMTLNHSAGPAAVAARPVDTNAPSTTRVAGTEVVVAPSAVTASNTGAAPSRAHALALAADVDGLSDGSLVQLMDDMTAFDGLPAAEPEPMLTVDSGDSSGQD
jgi:hypothetical protein